MRRLLLVLVLMVAPGVAHAGGGGVDTSGCAGYSEGTTVSMRDSCFAGTAHFAPSGTPITISNDGVLPHTLTAVDGSFDTGDVGAGQSTELTLTEPGIYRVFCSYHGTAAGEGMAGVVVVGDPATPVSAAGLTGAAPAGPVDSEPVVAEAPGSGIEGVVLSIAAGVAIGLAIAALLLALSLRRSEAARPLDRLQPSVD